jgi:hypothetical protein
MHAQFAETPLWQNLVHHFRGVASGTFSVDWCSPESQTEGCSHALLVLLYVSAHKQLVRRNQGVVVVTMLDPKQGLDISDDPTLQGKRIVESSTSVSVGALDGLDSDCTFVESPLVREIAKLRSSLMNVEAP